MNKPYYTILILDSCGDVYEEMLHNEEKKPFLSLRETALKVIDMKKHDKELGSDFGIWDYRIVKHEEDDETDWVSIYKVYKYAGKWKCKYDDKFDY